MREDWREYIREAAIGDNIGVLYLAYKMLEKAVGDTM